MKVFDLFSKRRDRQHGEVPDVYKYDDIPRTLRVQIVHILRDAIGKNVDLYQFVYETLCREYGVFQLNQDDQFNPRDTALFNFLLSTDDLDKALDVVELSFRIVDRLIRGNYRYESSISIAPDDAISELNFRFREHRVGYQFESGQIVRMDAQILHAEVVKPVLQLLGEDIYAGANEEFLKAHEHYRRGNHQECLNECLKAFESTMKAICSKRSWPYNQDDTAKRLISTCFSNDLIPDFLQSEFTALRSVLESGVPTSRNKLSGHGRGVQQRRTPEYFVSYVLHMTATSILFLVQAEKELP